MDDTVLAEGGRRSKRPRAAADVNNPLAGPAVRPLQCFTPDGKTALLHRCDVVFMTYESLRKELGYQHKCALASPEAHRPLYLLPLLPCLKTSTT